MMRCEASRIKRKRDEARDQGCAEPRFEVTGFFTGTFFPNPEVRASADAASKTGSRAQSGAQSGAQSAEVLSLLAQGPLSAAELASRLALGSKTGALKRTLKELLATGSIQYVLPDKPTSRLQKYRLAAPTNRSR